MTIAAYLDSIVPAIQRADAERKADFAKCVKGYRQSAKRDLSVKAINRLIDPILHKRLDPAVLLDLLESAYRYGFHDGETQRHRLRN